MMVDQKDKLMVVMLVYQMVVVTVLMKADRKEMKSVAQ
jgi:hypothetical protein